MHYKNPIQEIADFASCNLNAEAYLGVKAGDIRRHKHQNAVKVGSHRIYWKDCDLELAFSALYAGVLAKTVGVPVAPTIVHKAKAFGEFRVYSIAAFDIPITLASANRDKGITRWSERQDIENWHNAVSEITLPNKADMDFLLFRKTISHISSLLPFFAWVGENDIGVHNCVVDGFKLADCIADPKADKSIKLYGIDCYVNGSSIFVSADWKPSSAPDQFAEFAITFDTISTIEDNILDDTTLSDIEWQSGHKYLCDTAKELLLPYVDWDTAREITSRITNISKRSVHDSAETVRQTLSRLVSYH
ncbi:MAG: hypothetical protein HGA87_03980 [Desulfobulbaceae bacterium]|nr:hypothetical protein [Desulfobulbaceae bacterium]